MQKNLFHRALLGLIALLLPIPGLALSVTTYDTVAGLGTDLDVSALSNGQTATVSVFPPFGPEYIKTVTGNATQTANLQVPATETEIAGTYEVEVKTDSNTQTSTFEVLPGSIDLLRSSIQAEDDALKSDGINELAVSITVEDAWGNALANQPMKLISSRSTDHIVALSSATDKNGEQFFSVRTREPGTLTLRAIDMIGGQMLQSELIVNALDYSRAIGGNTDPTFYSGVPTAAPSTEPRFYGGNFRAQLTNLSEVAYFDITAPSEVRANDFFTITITARTSDGAIKDDFVGVFIIEATDPNFKPPVNGRGQMDVGNLGRITYSLGTLFSTPGEQILRVRMLDNPAIEGRLTINVIGNELPTGTNRQIDVPPEMVNQVTNNPELMIAFQTEPFLNLQLTLNDQTFSGESDERGEGSFNVSVAEVAGAEAVEVANTFTGKITDEHGLRESPKLSVAYDPVGPELAELSLTPEKPTEGTKALFLANVVDQTDIASFTLNFNEQSYDLIGEDNAFEELLTMPEAGDYPLVIEMSDVVGNVTTQEMLITVAAKGLPIVQNVRANSDQDGITVQWSPLPEGVTVTAYRIYVGETPQEFAFNLDTATPTTAARIAGLRPGARYFFAVTALDNSGTKERESEDKSPIATAIAPGLAITLHEGNGALQLDWSSLTTTTPLSSFIVRYGVEPPADGDLESYTEERFVDGAARNYTIRNLINDVTYYVALIPVSVTGEKLLDLSATAQGAPSSELTGFTITAADPAPFGAGLIGTTPNLHSGAPQTPGTGTAKSIAIILLVTGLGLALVWYKRRRNRQIVAFLHGMDLTYRQGNE